MVYSKYGSEPACNPLTVGDAENQPSLRLFTAESWRDTRCISNDGCANSVILQEGILTFEAYFPSRSIFLSLPLPSSFMTSLSPRSTTVAFLARQSEKSLDRLQRVLNAVAHLLKVVRKCDPITPILLHLHWIHVAFRIDFISRYSHIAV
jgi:hypothetical protein